MGPGEETRYYSNCKQQLLECSKLGRTQNKGMADLEEREHLLISSPILFLLVVSSNIIFVMCCLFQKSEDSLFLPYLLPTVMVKMKIQCL